MKRPMLQSSQGVASLEFMMMFMVFTALAFAVVEFGSQIHERNQISHLAREGASIYSRDLGDANMIVGVINNASQNLDFTGAPENHALFVARATSGNPPVCTATGGSGTLSDGEVVPPASTADCGLTPQLLAYLQEDVNGIAQMQQFSVVRIYYQHNPLTPLAGFLELPFFGGGGMDPTPVLTATAIF